MTGTKRAKILTLETQEVFAERAQVSGVSRALAGRYSGCEEQGKDAYREIVLARELYADERW